MELGFAMEDTVNKPAHPMAISRPVEYELPVLHRMAQDVRESLSGESKVSILRAEAEEAGAEIDVAGVGGDEVDGVGGVEVGALALRRSNDDQILV